MQNINSRASLRQTMMAGYFSVLALLGGFGAWAYFAELNGAVVAHATVVAESYSKKIQTKDGGIVARILVHDGDSVTAGQDLVALDPTEARAELGIVSVSLDELLIKRSRLEAQRDGRKQLELPEEITKRASEPSIASTLSDQQKLLTAATESDEGKLSQLRQQIEQIRKQIEGTDAQLSSNASQIALIAEELASLQGLAKKGLVAKSRLLSLEREQSRLQGLNGELTGGKATAEARISEVELRILQITEDVRRSALEELRDTEAKIAELQERRVALSARLDRMVIKAPIAGTIYQMAVHTEGGVVAPGDTLMLMVPEGDDLVLQAMVLPQNIDELTQGQEARVRFSTLNTRSTPELYGIVTQVAADASRVDANQPPFYTVRIRLNDGEVKKLEPHHLKPGMNAEAFIQTNKRSVLSYLLRPLIDQIGHAFREG